MPAAGQTIKPLVRMGRSPDACWTWLGPKTPIGHGKKTYCGRDVMAHRWVWEMLFGPIPRGKVVYHICDSKECTNPAHLALGSQADANRRSINVTLLPADVDEIRAAKPTWTRNTARQLAAKFGCSTTTVHEVARGRTWTRARPNNGPRQCEARHG